MKEEITTDWLNNLSDSIYQWLETIHDPEHPGYYKYSKEGAILKPSRDSGLGTSCLALRTLYMIDALDKVPEKSFNDWVAYIRSFQKKKRWGQPYGYFEDRKLLKILDRKAGLFKYNVGVRRAETRQACGSLLSVGEKPLHPVFGGLPQTPEEADNYIKSLPWINPWHSGSHASLLIFFLKMNAEYFGYAEEYEKLIPVILKHFDKLQDKDTGTWFTGTPPFHNIVNGAMKVITGYVLLKMAFPYPERLIDTALTAINDEDACNNVDLVYVLHSCCKLTEHRIDEIREFAIKRLYLLKKFVNKDGAFSFRSGCAGTHYYGVRISRGYQESDVHGTNLFVWAIAMLSEIINSRAIIKFKLPVI